MAMARVRVLVPAARRFLRPRNTDWRYAAQTLPMLAQYCDGLEIQAQANPLVDAQVNLRYGMAMARARGWKWIPRRWDYALEQDCPVYASDLEKTRAEVLLSYERFPTRAFGRPVVWITSPSYPEILRGYGLTDQRINELLAWKRERVERASRLVFTTEVSLRKFAEQNGEPAMAKSVVIPFFIPGLRALEDVAGKWQRPGLKLLFVGREARRKGLALALAGALPLLRARPDVSFTIISSMDDGEVEIPAMANITVFKETERAHVLRLMAESHVLVMPSSFESYGFVYVEAMSQGCVPLAVDRPVQRELLGDGGIVVSGQGPEEITEALEAVMRDRDGYLARALSGVKEFRRRHESEVVAGLFGEVCGAVGANAAPPAV